MEIFRFIITRFVVMLLIYFILIRALGSIRYRKKGLIIFIISLLLSCVFILAYILDLKYATLQSKIDYYIYIIINASFGITYLVYNFIKYPKYDYVKYNPKRNKNYQRISRIHNKQTLYLLFEYKDEYLLKKQKETHSGLNIPLKKGEFHDETIETYLSKKSVTNYKVNVCGKYTDLLKKIEFSVYLINLEDELNLKGYQYIHISKIRFLELNEFDKEIIYRVLIKDKFDIER